jgi:transcriptional regulator with XRE-family HTH domain
METSKDTISRIERGEIVTDIMLWWYSQIFQIDLGKLYILSRQKFILELEDKYNV